MIPTSDYRKLAEKYYSTQEQDWESVKPIKLSSLDRLVDLPKLDPLAQKTVADKLVVCKLNGGLGTSMGCVGPKSAMEVRHRKSFLDLIVEQMLAENDRTGTTIELMLMNSFYTEKDTSEIIKKYEGKMPVRMFTQSKRQRLRRDTFAPLSAEDFGDEAFYPPGHGDFYHSIGGQGILDQLINLGKEYIFVSNSDNLGATIELRIPAYMQANELAFVCEVAERTRADIKGGTFIECENGAPKLLEVAQVADENRRDFESIAKFSIFNTNNVWIHLPALKKALSNNELRQDLIFNNKNVGGIPVVQIETALASSISSFEASRCLLVERSRFLPVKKTDDLFVVRSDLFEIKDGRMLLSPKRQTPDLPLVRLGKCLEAVEEMERRVPHIPSIIDLELLTVVGDVHFGRDIRLANKVLVTCTGEKLQLPDGCVLNNQAYTGGAQIAEL